MRARIARARRVRAFSAYLRFLEESFVTPERLEKVQAELLERIVAHAYERVPFQRRRLQEAGLRPGDLRRPVDLQRIAPVTKRDLREIPAEELLDRQADPARTRRKATSGSTGEPFGFYLDRTYLDRGSAARLFLYRQIGYSSGRVVELFDNPKARGQAALAPRGIERHTVHYRMPVDDQATVIERLAARLVYGNRSHLVALAEEFERRGRRPASLAWAVSSSEMLHEADRELLAGWLAPGVHDVYGLAEVEVAAFQPRPTGPYRVLMPRVVVEVLNDGEPAAPGETGEVVVTGLDNDVMPFLRYATGDVATVDAVSSSGAVLALRSIEGRVVDRLRRSDGTLVTAWDAGTSAFWGRREITEHVRQWQIIQDETGAVAVTVVPTAVAVPAQVRDDIAAFVTATLGGVTVVVREASQVDLEPNGKFRAVKSAAH